LLLIYNSFIALYRFAVWISSFKNEKADKWLAGRKDWRNKMATQLKAGETRIWVHCASLGEFEQGKPLIELLKEKHPNTKIVLTFFSPSGYEGCRNYTGADYIFYLPMDSHSNAADFLALVQPKLAIFIKYEFWYHYLTRLKTNKINTILVAAAFRPDQAFFKWYGGFFRSLLSCFTHIHVQDGVSAKLLQAIGISKNVTISGDTRYDRVSAISAGIRPIPVVEQFKGNHKVFIAGSTWPDDEALIAACLTLLNEEWKVIIAPHEIDAKHIDQVTSLLGNNAVCYSELVQNEHLHAKKILIIDNIGMLSSLYAYGEIAYVGGGFQKGGIHNVLEPSVFGLPVIIGPVYQKFVEAVSLVGAKTTFPVNNAKEAGDILKKLASDSSLRESVKTTLQKFMRKKTGAAVRILQQIESDEYI
jgi:3-deoxy-D-manno-octulosonic-acid transferase